CRRRPGTRPVRLRSGDRPARREIRTRSPPGCSGMTALAFYAPLKPPDSPVPSGDRRMARLLMQALAEAGYGVTLASRFRSYDGRGDCARQARLSVLGRRLADRLVRRWQERPPRAWFTYHLYYKAPDWL